VVGAEVARELEGLLQVGGHAHAERLTGEPDVAAVQGERVMESRSLSSWASAKRRRALSNISARHVAVDAVAFDQEEARVSTREVERGGDRASRRAAGAERGDVDDRQRHGPTIRSSPGARTASHRGPCRSRRPRIGGVTVA
jgi:hypothetical protein